MNQQTFAFATWCEISTMTHEKFFCGVTNDFISSIKAKLVAVIVALLTVPMYVSVSIYTDSQNLVTTYQQLHTFAILQYPQEYLKVTYIDL